MAAGDVVEIADSFTRLLANHRVGDVTTEGLIKLHALFGSPTRPGVQMALRALAHRTDLGRLRTLGPAFLDEMPRP